MIENCVVLMLNSKSLRAVIIEIEVIGKYGYHHREKNPGSDPNTPWSSHNVSSLGKKVPVGRP
jgi:hypothetical protein